MRTTLLTVLIAITAFHPAAAQEPQIERGSRSRALAGGWGHSWRFGVPGWNKTQSDVTVVAFHPSLGWFVTDRLELYGEGTLLVYARPRRDLSVGVGGLGGRHHLKTRGRVLPYVSLGAGVLWTSLDVPEIDRVFNFQIFYGVGLRVLKARNPGWIIEVRNHHISNAGTAGENLGLNAITLVGGVQWIVK